MLTHEDENSDDFLSPDPTMLLRMDADRQAALDRRTGKRNRQYHFAFDGAALLRLDAGREARQNGDVEWDC